jgi:outer membrane protein OmpA-like peptidoglycan-associated protein
MKISLDRANAVAAELVRQGVPPDRLEVIAQGARMPIYAETSPTGEAGNRRAEIFIEYVERS